MKIKKIASLSVGLILIGYENPNETTSTLDADTQAWKRALSVCDEERLKEE